MSGGKSVNAATAALPAGGDQAGHYIGVSISCFGVEFHPICNTPFGKLIGIDVYTDDPSPARLNEIARLFGVCEPLFIGPMEFIAIFKDGAESAKGLGSIPGDANNLNAHKRLF
jgi:hypothetical protein